MTEEIEHEPLQLELAAVPLVHEPHVLPHEGDAPEHVHVPVESEQDAVAIVVVLVEVDVDVDVLVDVVSVEDVPATHKLGVSWQFIVLVEVEVEVEVAVEEVVEVGEIVVLVVLSRQQQVYSAHPSPVTHAAPPASVQSGPDVQPTLAGMSSQVIGFTVVVAEVAVERKFACSVTGPFMYTEALVASPE